MKNRLTALLIATLLVLSGAAHALTPPAKSAQEAAKRAQQRAGGGRVLGIRELKKNGQPVYDVKVLSGGKVRVLRIQGDQ